MNRLTMKVLPAAVLSVLSGGALASGFQLLEQNASGLGNAYAGSAVVAENASTIFFNPAGLSVLGQGKHVSLGANFIDVTATFNNGASTAPTAPPRAFGTSAVDPGKSAIVPNGYFGMSLNPQWSIGVGFGAPFGLATKYPNDWNGRFQGVESELITININPTISYKVSDRVSIGFGLNYQEAEATLSSVANTAAGEFLNTIKGDDNSWGYNFGVLWQVSDATRIGAAYRSSVKYTLKGTKNSAPTGVGAVDAALNGDVTAALKLPDSFTLSASTRLNDRWEILGDVAWTNWSTLQELRILNTSGTTHLVNFYNWKDTWRVAVGANYRYSDSTRLKFGIAHDSTPIPDDKRAVRVPDQDRVWLSIGAQYKLAKSSDLDVGFSYLFVKDASINSRGDETVAGNRGLVNGTYKGNVKILGVQYSTSF